MLDLTPKNVRELTRIVSDYKYGDFLAGYYDLTYANDKQILSYADGYITKAMITEIGGVTTILTPNLVESLRLAGFTASVNGIKTFEFETFTGRNIDKNLSPQLAFAIVQFAFINSPVKGKTLASPNIFDDSFLSTNVQKYAYSAHLTNAFVKFVAEMESRFGASLLATAKAYFDTPYEPLQNYSMKEGERIDNGATSETTENTNVTTTTGSSGNVYGFNSDESVPLNEGEGSSTTTGDAKDNVSHTETTFGQGRTLERSGNIGVTSQQMLQSEIELRRYDFIEQFCKCFERVMFASVYR